MLLGWLSLYSSGWRLNLRGLRLNLAALVPAPLVDLSLGQPRESREVEKAFLAPVGVSRELLGEHVHLASRLTLPPPYYLIAHFPVAQSEGAHFSTRDRLFLIGLFDRGDFVLGAAIVPRSS